MIDKVIIKVNDETKIHIDGVTYDLDNVIAAIEKQIPKKPKMDNDNGIYEVEVCPYCMRKLFPNEHHCKCGQALDWSK